MTYKTRQEVFRAAADWMDVCEKAGVKAWYKFTGEIGLCSDTSFKGNPEGYEFPLALLEGKEVWIGSELWNVPNNFKFIANRTDVICGRRRLLDGKEKCGWIEDCSWNPPKPKTVMVEMPVEDAESYSKYTKMNSLAECCKKALESLK